MTVIATPPSVGRFASASRRRRWRRWSGRSALAGFTAAALAGGAGYVALGTDVLAVQTVEVAGARDVPRSAVLSAARVPVGAPMARLDRGAVRDRILAALPGVATVSVERAWPSTVRLVVHERAPAAAVPEGGRYLLVDRAGVAYRTVPTVPAGSVILRVRNPYTQDAAARAGLSVLAGLPPELRELVARVNAPTAQQVELILTDKRRILWGSPADSAAKGAVVRVLLTRPGQVIDVSAPGMATVR